MYTLPPIQINTYIIHQLYYIYTYHEMFPMRVFGWLASLHHVIGRSGTICSCTYNVTSLTLSVYLSYVDQQAFVNV